MSFSLPIKLNGPISEREAVADALYRVVLAFDQADEELLRSAVTEDVSMQMLDMSFNGIAEVKTGVYDRVAKMDTTHLLSNVRVDLKSGTEAALTCSAMAVHARTGEGVLPDGPKFTSCGFYACDVVKVGDLWKLKTWMGKFVWFKGDRSVMSNE